ncbi:MAG: hypothetical protein H6765_04125 [Candidatus Peribacteria bacterium]|nr:MAG: hypothetical protein H6765_04125 [Candidatus Peribacteria bacterium]
MCNAILSLNFAPFDEPATLPVDFVGTQAGTTVLVVDACVGDVCTQKSINFYVAPSQLASLGLSVPTDVLPV